MIELILVLMGAACSDANYYLQTTDYIVTCTDDVAMWQVMGEYHWLTEYYNVIYVDPNYQDDDTYGIAYTKQHYAHAFWHPQVVKHEAQHLECQCHFTPDGLHDGEKRH